MFFEDYKMWAAVPENVVSRCKKRNPVSLCSADLDGRSLLYIYKAFRKKKAKKWGDLAYFGLFSVKTDIKRKSHPEGWLYDRLTV